MLWTANEGSKVASWANPENTMRRGTTTVFSRVVRPDVGVAPSIVYG
jgi:hypothetical protein